MFEVSRIYNRMNEIHKLYGGQQQGGISTPTNHPYIFLFTGESGEKYGYEDKFRPDGTFWYTGEGQIGNMEMKRGNLSVRDHQKLGKSLFLFECVKKGYVRYIGEAVYVGHHIEQRIDKNGNYRDAIIFHLALMLDSKSTSIREQKAGYKIDTKGLKAKSLENLRNILLSQIPKTYDQIVIKTSTTIRSEAIKIYALKRANGLCEGCGNPAPFSSKDGPFLEVHHINRKADGGPDLPENVAALCPNCHRRVHFAVDKEEYNNSIMIKIKGVELEITKNRIA